jgi:hypothetical protein
MDAQLIRLSVMTCWQIQTLSTGRTYFEGLRPVHLALLFDQPWALQLGLERTLNQS